ncbi:MAG: hypothetical protein ABFS10_08250 [Bacteroidota bacterium]
MKTTIITAVLILASVSLETSAQVNVYRSGGGEVILSGADVNFTGVSNTTKVSTNPRFTVFLHIQQMYNLDLNNNIGFYAGAALRNVGLIMEDRYQYLGFVDDTQENWDKDVKVKRRSYSLGFPIALKLGMIDKHYFIYAGGEYEWMFHYKQKLFVDDIKAKEKEWGSDRVNPWNPSVFAGVQFPGGLNLKVKFYLKDFLNHDYVGKDFGQDVNYSQFESTGIWYISLAMVINKQQLKKMLESQEFEKSAYLY